MLNAAIRSTSIPTLLLDASFALAHSRTRSDVVAAIEQGIRIFSGESPYDLISCTAGEYSLRSAPATLAAPGPEARQHLAMGLMANEKDICFVPLIAGGELQGWITLADAGTFDPMMTLWAAQSAAALAATDTLASSIQDLEQRNRQLAEVVRIGNVFRSTISVDELTKQIVFTIQT